MPPIISKALCKKKKVVKELNEELDKDLDKEIDEEKYPWSLGTDEQLFFAKERVSLISMMGYNI